ncbi:MAG: tetratricopeptide repeat protein [Ginsengibacter sp.]
MRKIKIMSLFSALFLCCNILMAQNIDDGKRFLYYERYNSAKDIFTKLVNANPNNADAVYWLGQALIGQEDIAGAKALYQKSLSANPNSPLLLTGMGHVELYENKPNDARNHFETAISLSKGKDANVLNAVGRANVDAKAGDAAYAIEKLKTAADLNKKSPEIFVNLGDAYRKITDGANAQISYQNALTLDPNYARASFMIGRLYQTQGFTQEPIYMKYYNDALTKDPKFAPGYGWLSEYYYRRDINKSREYLDKYIAVADADSKNCYYQASFLYASGKNQEAITKADQCIAAGGPTAYAKLYGIKAYAYDKAGDSMNAKTNFELLFQKLPADQLGPKDYSTYGKTLLKIPGNGALASSYIEKAIALDSLEADKIDDITPIAQSYLATNDYAQAGNWYRRILYIKKDYSNLDLYNAGYNFYRGDNYSTSDSIFNLYTQKYPTDIFGWYMRARASEGLDSTGVNGLAKPYYEKVIGLTDTAVDKEKVKSQLITAYKYMVAYNYNVKNDRTTALQYTDKILALDPADATALANRTALSAPVKVKVKDNVTKEKSPGSKTKELPTKKKVKDK